MEVKKRGKIILIEGTDKSGKETQTNLLTKRLIREGIPTQKMHFPRYDTPTGRIIGQCYLGKEGPREGVLWEGKIGWFKDAHSVEPRIATLYFLADQSDASEEIKKIISSGHNLALDRYLTSSMGHQGGKANTPEEREKIVNFVYNVGYNELGLPKPDITLLLYTPYNIGKKLGEKMSEKPDGHESNPEHLIGAEGCYLYLAKRFGWEVINCAPDGINQREIEDIHEEVYQYVKENL